MDLNTVEAIVSPRTRSDMPALGPGDALLAGGTWLFSEPQRHLRRLVDLAALRWDALRITEDGLHIAATCRIAELHALPAPESWLAAHLIDACCNALLGSFKVWNEATVGGNLCLGLPAGPMTALASGLDGVCTIWTPDGGERRIEALHFVCGDRKTTLAHGEVLRAIDIPVATLRRRAAFRQIALSPVGRSAALLIGTRADDGRFALTITAATPNPVRIETAQLPEAAALSSAIDLRAVWFDDVHGNPAWRRLVTLRLAEEIRQELACG